MSNMDNIERLERQQSLIKLENEHAELDQTVALQLASPGYDQIVVSRLKRRKLQLKDMIVKLKSSMLPDVPS